MNLLSIFSFFMIMLVLAAIPSASVALVVARSASLGVRNGIAASIGIISGDLIFVVIAVLGMSTLAVTLSSLFVLLKYLAGIYLIWLGIKLVRSNKENFLPLNDDRPSSLLASFTAGLLLTLGDVKAIFFYASLLPVLVDLNHLSVFDFFTIIFVTVFTVGGVKCCYAMTARSLVMRMPSRRISGYSKKIAGILMMGAGGWLILKS